jgi:membrane-anchored protein YejM (alkaline phosphatase superfamily)
VPPGASIQGRLHARYLTAVHYVDSLVGRVLDDLERRQLLDRTVVIVTADHGMQFEEHGLGFDGHGTGFTRSQLQTPLVTDGQWDWLIAADYTNYALGEPEQVTVVLSRGYEIRDRNYHLVRHPTVPHDSLRAALREMSRFYR